MPTLGGLAEALEAPRVVWVMVPSGRVTDETITALAEVLGEGDLVIDGGNSRYTEDAPHAKLLGDKGIAFIDAGVSGGIWGLTEGYGLMVGGSEADVERAMPIFDTLRPPGPREDGFVHAGPVGAGHLRQDGAQRHRVRADDGIRRGLRAAGRRGPDQDAAGRRSRRGPTARWCGPGCSSCWPRRSRKTRNFNDITGYTEDSGEGRWTVEEAISQRVPVPGDRGVAVRPVPSRQDDSPTMKAVAALRNQFGGHAVKRISESG